MFVVLHMSILHTNVFTSVCLNFVVKEDTLLDMVLCMTDEVGLVHQMPFTCDRDGFAATLEKVKFMYLFNE
jgi:hypothetical protein